MKKNELVKFLLAEIDKARDLQKDLNFGEGTDDKAINGVIHYLDGKIAAYRDVLEKVA